MKKNTGSDQLDSELAGSEGQFAKWVEERYGPRCLATYERLRAAAPTDDPMIVLEAAVSEALAEHYVAEGVEFGRIRCDSP